MTQDANKSALDELCQLLRTVQPSLEAQRTNHLVVAAELEQLNPRAKPALWWRNFVSIPVPLAYGLGAVACIVVVIPCLSLFQTSSQPRSSRLSEGAFESVSRYDDTGDEQALVTSTYLCGVGRIEHETIRKFKYGE